MKQIVCESNRKGVCVYLWGGAELYLARKEGKEREREEGERVFSSPSLGKTSHFWDESDLETGC